MATERTAMTPFGVVVHADENKDSMTPFGFVANVDDLSAAAAGNPWYYYAQQVINWLFIGGLYV